MKRWPKWNRLSYSQLVPTYWIANRDCHVCFRYIRGVHIEALHPIWNKHSRFFFLNIERCYRWWHHVICREGLGFKLRCKWGPCSSGLLRSVWYCLSTGVLGSVSSPIRIGCFFLVMGPMGCPETSVNSWQQTLWYVVLKLLWIYESDFVSKNRSATVPSRIDSRQRCESRMLADMDTLCWKRFLQLPAFGRNFESLFCRWF